MRPRRKHFVTFESPGTFVHETSTRSIASWNIPAAARMATKIIERYGARPFAFYFETQLVADPVPDGEGGTLKVLPKTVKRSGRYFLNATLETVDEIAARNDPSERILVLNMDGNDWPIVAVSTNGWRSVQPFNVEDFVVDAKGKVTKAGNDPLYVKYRTLKRRRRQ